MIATQELESFLTQSVIPTIQEQPQTFLGIAKQPHYENVLSNILAFYFQPSQEHGLGNLFVSSLLNLIHEKASQRKDIYSSDDLSVETEYGTKKGGRIDLLLLGTDEAVIIENKVYHTLNNDLKDYWNTIINTEKINAANMYGVVLSLNPISNTGHSEFVNITHHEFLTAVMNNVGGYLLKASDKYLVFLKDLYQNIINLSNANMEAQEMDFYFKYQEQINKAASLRDSMKDFVFNEVDKAGNSIHGVNVLVPRTATYNRDRLRWYCSEIDSNLVITVLVEELLKTGKMGIYVELWGNLLNDKDQYDVVSKALSEQERSLLHSDFKSVNRHWAHFASKQYELKASDIQTLSQFIQSKIEGDGLLNIFRKMEELVKRKALIKNENK